MQPWVCMSMRCRGRIKSNSDRKNKKMFLFLSGPAPHHSQECFGLPLDSFLRLESGSAWMRFTVLFAAGVRILCLQYFMRLTVIMYELYVNRLEPCLCQKKFSKKGIRCFRKMFSSVKIVLCVQLMSPRIASMLFFSNSFSAAALPTVAAARNLHLSAR